MRAGAALGAAILLAAGCSQVAGIHDYRAPAATGGSSGSSGNGGGSSGNGGGSSGNGGGSSGNGGSTSSGGASGSGGICGAKTNCGGTCVDTRTDPDHCGACSHKCTAAPHASATCTAGVCALECSAGYADCDKRASSGCEAALQTDPKNCGACGKACSATGTCIAGKCHDPWLETFGGGGTDSLNGVQVDAAGTIYADGDTSSAGAGQSDGWLLKLDAGGKRLLERTLGGTKDDDLLRPILEGTKLTIAGAESSSLFNAELNDGWLVQVDTSFDLANGFQTRVGDGQIHTSVFKDVVPAAGGGYLAVGTLGFEPLDNVNHSFWIARFDASGAYLGSPRIFYNGTYYTGADSIGALPGGGYVVAGESNDSKGADSTWVVALDSSFKTKWANALRLAAFVPSTSDNHVLVQSNGILVATTALVSGTNTDGWLFKLDFNGALLWQKRYGGSAPDRFTDVVGTSDGNALVVGSHTTGTGDSDAWVVKVKPDGTILGQVRLDHPGADDVAESAAETPDGDFVVVGEYGTDAFVAKLRPDLGGCAAATSVQPAVTAGTYATLPPANSTAFISDANTTFQTAKASSITSVVCQ